MDNMEKNDILEKAKKENKNGDEMYSHFYRQGAQMAMAIGLIVCVIATIVDLILNSKYTLLGYFAFLIEISMQFPLHLFLAIKTKNKANKVSAILFGIALVIWLVLTVTYIFGIGV